MLRLKVASRGSKLSLKQVEIAMSWIRRAIPNLTYEVVIVKTKGDIVTDKPLYAIGSKGLFEKEVNKAILEGKADIAVHSMKDLPSDIDPRLEIVYIPPRDSPNEALVPARGRKPLPLKDIPKGSIIGTSSVRRRALILHYNPSLNIKVIRGNLDTRLRKLDNEAYDYIVVAEAGLKRLNINRPYYRLPLEEFPPAPCQGLIAVVGLADSKIAMKLKSLIDKTTWAVAIAERSLLRHANAGCHVPLGGVAQPYGTGMLRILAVVLSYDGSKAAWIKLKGDMERAEELGKQAGEIIYSIYDKLIGG